MDFTEYQRNAPIGAAKEKDPILVEYSLHLYAAIGRLGILNQFFVEPLACGREKPVNKLELRLHAA